MKIYIYTPKTSEGDDLSTLDFEHGQYYIYFGFNSGTLWSKYRHEHIPYSGFIKGVLNLTDSTVQEL